MRKGHWRISQWLGIMSRMNREVHVRIWERLGVKFPWATRHEGPSWQWWWLVRNDRQETSPPG